MLSTPTDVAGVLSQARRCGRAADIEPQGAVLRAAVARFVTLTTRGKRVSQLCRDVLPRSSRLGAIRDARSLDDASLRTICVLLGCQTLWSNTEQHNVCTGACDLGLWERDRNALRMQSLRCGGVS